MKHFGHTHEKPTQLEASVYFRRSADSLVASESTRFAFDPFLDADFGEPVEIGAIDVGQCRLFHLALPVDADHVAALDTETFAPFAGVYLIRELHRRHQPDGVRVVGIDADPDQVSGVLLAGYLEDELAAVISAAMTEVGVLSAVVLGSTSDHSGTPSLRVLGAMSGSVKLVTDGLDLEAAAVR